MAAIKQYRVSLFRADDDPTVDEPLEVREGCEDLPQSILVDGFNRMLEIELSPYWQKMQEHKLEEFQMTTRTNETFVKFGEVTQKTRDYLLVFEVEH